jgi:hypothetical protein
MKTTLYGLFESCNGEIYLSDEKVQLYEEIHKSNNFDSELKVFSNLIFYDYLPGVIGVKLYSSFLMLQQTRLECTVLARFFMPISHLQVQRGANLTRLRFTFI